MSNSFYKLFEKIQTIKEQDQMDAASKDVKQPSIIGKDNSMPDPNMQLGVKNDIAGEIDQAPEAGEDDNDNLSLPEGSVDIDQIIMSLDKIKKMIPKFKTMDKDKSEQLDDLIKQTTNLVSSFSSDEDQDSTEEESDEKITDQDLIGDKMPSFGDEEGPAIKQTPDSGEMPARDASAELPAINTPDQQQM